MPYLAFTACATSLNAMLPIFDNTIRNFPELIRQLDAKEIFTFSDRKDYSTSKPPPQVLNIMDSQGWKLVNVVLLDEKHQQCMWTLHKP